MRQVNNFRIFKKIIRKYHKRHCVKRIDHFGGKRFISYWEKEDWIGYRIEKLEQLTDAVKKEILLEVGGYVLDAVDLEEYLVVKPNVWFDDNSDETLYFRGIMITNRDAYAILGEAFGKNEYLYPIHKLINCKNNINPCC